MNLALYKVSNLHISTVVLLFLLEKCESRLHWKGFSLFNKKVIVCLIDTLRVDV